MRICFVALNIYPVLSGATDVKQVGGAEVQQVQLGRLLRQLGHDVSYVTLDYGQPDGATIDGCTVFKAYKPTAGIPGLRYIHPRWTGIWRALKRANCDLYYTRGAGMLVGLLVLYRHIARCRVVYAAANDLDFERGRELIRSVRDRWLFRFGLRRADAIIAQSNSQKRVLADCHRLTAEVIPNFLNGESRQLPIADRSHVLWVGWIRHLKRPMMFVELARRLPQTSFVMIGPPDPSDPALYQAVEKAACSILNLKFLGFRSFEETEGYFDRCTVLVSTSVSEGFPNIFLQAMRRGIPIVSFVDPDGLITTNGLGRIVADATQLRAAVETLAKPPFAPSEPILECYERKYSQAAVVESYRRLFEDLAK